MRVLHLAAVDAEGGAARAAYRLHQGLLQAGADSSMLVKKKVSACDSVHVAPPPDRMDAFFWDLMETYYLGLNRTPISNTYFSIGAPSMDLSQHPFVLEADILHLHWVADFQSPVGIARLQALGKPIVWTLHDQRPFTGGCHFSAGCTRYENECDDCPQLQEDPLGVPAINLKDQLQLRSGTAITVVAPSRWLAQCARQSALFSGARTEVIPYGVDTDRFCPRARAEAKARLGLPPKSFHFLFGADFGSEKRKGFDELIAALQLCWKNGEFRERIRNGQLGLLAFGRPHEELTSLPMPVKSLGYLKEDESLSWIYSAADLFLVPSLEDNLPNTALESMSCGTPVLAFNVGGLPDLVKEGTGQLVSAVDIDALSQAMLSLSANPASCEGWRTNCRAQMTREFTVSSQAQRYRELYEQLLKGTAYAPKPANPQANVGSQLQGIYSELLLHALTRFSSRIKGASAIERQACRDLIQMLGDKSTDQQKLTELKATLMAAETERVANRLRRQQEKTSGKNGLAGLLRKWFCK